jgi:O-antigen ligase
LAANVTQSEPFRLAQYGTTWRVLQEHPLLGVGLGNLTRRFEEFKDPLTPAGFIATTTENMYLMILCETGLLGGLVFVLLLGKLFWILYGCVKTGDGVVERGLALASLASLAGFVINMFTWDGLNQPTVRITFWIIAGIGLCTKHLTKSRI